MKNPFLNCGKIRVKLEISMLEKWFVSNYRVDAENEEKYEYNVGQKNEDEKKIKDDDVSCGRKEKFQMTPLFICDLFYSLLNLLSM